MKIRTTIKTLISIGTAIGLLTLSACGTPPKREPYAGADLVGEINPAQLVGNWKINILNPIPGEDDATVTTAYKNDGTWTSVVIPSAEQNKDLGPMKFAGQGVWQINGDALFAKMNDMQETTGHKFGGVMEYAMSAFMSKMSGSVNAYEVSANRLIFVNEENGQATLLERL